MRNIYLIFRRDYLGYVRAWGFWLSLAAVPLFMIIGGTFALFAAKSSPVRYYAVVEPAAVYADAIEGEFALNDEDASQQARDMAAKAGKPIGILGFGTDLARGYFARGFDFVAVAGDSWLLARQFDALIAGMKD